MTQWCVSILLYRETYSVFWWGKIFEFKNEKKSKNQCESDLNSYSIFFSENISICILLFVFATRYIKLLLKKCERCVTVESDQWSIFNQQKSQDYKIPCQSGKKLLITCHLIWQDICNSETVIGLYQDT